MKNQSDDWRESLTWYTRTTIVPRFIKHIGIPLFKLIMQVEAIDVDNLPSGPCILASNHINNFDVLTIANNLPRYPFFMTKEELFKNPIRSWIFRLSGGFPVKRGKRDTWALQQAGRVLQSEQMLCMFPEGTRSGRKAQLRRGKPGTVMLALENKVPIAPLAIFGTQYVRVGRTRPKVTIRVGEPIDVVSMAGPPPHSTDIIRELTTALMQRIAAMLPPEHQGVYA